MVHSSEIGFLQSMTNPIFSFKTIDVASDFAQKIKMLSFVLALDIYDDEFDHLHTNLFSAFLPRF